MRIIGPPTATWEQILPNLRVQGSALFADTIAPAVWAAALDYDIDPVGAVAQSAHETGYGRFGRALHPWHRNTCGLKVRDLKALAELGVSGDSNPICHAQFATWRQGAIAQMQHLWAYAGREVPTAFLVDPRYDWVIGKGPFVNFDDLGGTGRWAPNPNYGQLIVHTATEIVNGRSL